MKWHLLACVVCLELCYGSGADFEDNDLHLSLAITAKHKNIQIFWKNFPAQYGNTLHLVLTEVEPKLKFIKVIAYHEPISTTSARSTEQEAEATWTLGSKNQDVLYTYKLNEGELKSGWLVTDVHYNRGVEAHINMTTSMCYGYWVSLIEAQGNVLNTTCIRTHPTWMNDMHQLIGNSRIRDLFIPGSHDSAAYKTDYNRAKNESLVNKYSITQDDDIRTQLIHGIRYLDIRVGYYKYLDIKFWANHGISRQKPLVTILNQVREFVYETHEIVILDFQEFPVGFGKTVDIHKKLIALIQREIGEVMIEPIGWRCTMNEIWATGKYLIVSYDNSEIRQLHPDVLWQSVQQKWGNVKTLRDLRGYMERITDELKRSISNRPIAAMTELTPDVWGVISDEYGGLRKMADSVNTYVTLWFRDEWGAIANIVAPDFVRGTTIVETALHWNKKKTEAALARYSIFNEQ